MIQIKNPCDANWQEMTPTNAGKFCGACEKVVVDFSKMNDAEIENYFIEYASQKTCGRFLTSQVGRSLSEVNKSFSSKLWSRVIQFPVLNSVTLLFASSIFWLSSCVKNNVVTGEVNNNICEPMIMGDSINPMPTDDTTVQIKEDTIHILQGEVSQSVDIKMGKVMLVDTISQKIIRKK